MRNTTKTFVASVGMGICAISYAIGANSAAGTGFSTVALNNTAGNNETGSPASNSATPSSSASASQSSPSSASASNSGSTKITAAGHKKTKKKSQSSSGSTGSTGTTNPAPSSSPTSSSTPTPKPSSSTPTPNSTKVTKTGAMIQGNDPFGDYAQIQVTKTNGKVTAVQVVSSYSNGGREAVFPYLAQEAVASNGSAVANYSGATYTTIVFNKALASAMSKF